MRVRDILTCPLSVWKSIGLVRQLLVLSCAVTICVMLVAGAWIARRIEVTVAQNASIQAALFVESYIGDRIQGLAESNRFDPAVQKELERLVLRTAHGRRIAGFKVWVRGRRIVYASNRRELNKKYPATKSLRKAWQGLLAYEVDQLDDSENAAERALNMPLLEIYVPVRKHFGGDVFAIVEFYEDASFLTKDIWKAKIEAWLFLGVLGVLIILALVGGAARAGGIIKRQSSALNKQIHELSKLLEQNRRLRSRVEESSRRTTALNERYLRRIGADLHDGPAQLIALALVHLDSSRPGRHNGADIRSDPRKVREPLWQALNEIRNISMGLALPELDCLSLEQIAYQAIESFEHRTNRGLDFAVGKLAPTASPDAKIATYRILQEALNNAAKHAPKSQIFVRVGMRNANAVAIQVGDNGPGFDPASVTDEQRIGLAAMRERVECLGGWLEVRSHPGQGTWVLAEYPPGGFLGPER